jgi:hypothetical protein
MSVTIRFGAESRSVPRLLFAAKCATFANDATVTIPAPYDRAAVTVFLGAVEGSSFNIPLDVLYEVQALSEHFGYAQLSEVTAGQIEALRRVDGLHQRLLEFVFALEQGRSPDGGFVLANFDALRVYPAFARIPPDYLQTLLQPDGDAELQSKLTTSLIRSGRWAITPDAARGLRASQVQIAADGGLELPQDVRSRSLPFAAHAREIADEAEGLAREIDAAVSEIRQTTEATLRRQRVAAVQKRAGEAGVDTRAAIAALAGEIADANVVAGEVERIRRNAADQVERGTVIEGNVKAMLAELKRLEEQLGIE